MKAHGYDARVFGSGREILASGLPAANSCLIIDVALLRQQSKSLQERMVSEQKKLTTLERQLVETRMQLTTIERGRDACDIAYRGILNRIEEARLSADENTAMVKLVQAAGVPTIPVRQKQYPFTLFGLLFGFAGGLVLALVSDTLEDHVTSLADVAHGIGLKVLGIVPHILRIERSDLAKAGLSHRHGQLTESFAGKDGDQSGDSESNN